MLIRRENLEHVAAAVFSAMGSPEHEAEIVARSLVVSNLMGHDSHGVGLIATYVEHFRGGLLFPGTSAARCGGGGAILMFDGRLGFGRRVGGEAMAQAIETCRESGVALMTLRNAHHLGRIGAYGEMAMDAGLVSIHFVNVTGHAPLVTPWGGTAGRFVTNPVCIAFPGTAQTPPTLLDMATSRIALGKARVAMTRGETLDAGLLVDHLGRPSSDPGVVFAEPRGALQPFGSYKGSGLALMCELLAGGLSGGGTIQPRNPRAGGIVNNMFTIVVDPAGLVDHGWLASEIDAMVGYVKSTIPANPAHPVVVAGDRERETARERGREGIPLDDAEWKELLDAGGRVGLARKDLLAIAC